MSNEDSSKNIPRRKFIKNFSSGVLGTSVLLKSVPAKETKEPLSAFEQEQEQRKIALSLIVNKKQETVKVLPETTLAELLRNDLNLTGTKIVCNHGECGSCTVLLDNQIVYSCHMLAMDAAGKEVITIEGLLDGDNLHPIQDAFIEKDGLQCGFCTPGQILSAYALLLKNPQPDKEQIVKAMSGNLCRCGAYPKIIESVMLAAEKIK
jgi:xanthine dehydrogenase YagT iron-sulfur-binding subunit